MKINVNDEQAVTDAIKNAEGRARTRTLSFYDIDYAVRNADRLLENNEIPRRYRKGCTISFIPEKVANSYNGIPEGTFATVTRGATGWFLTSIERGRSGNKSRGGAAKAILNLSEEAIAHTPTSFEV